MNLPDGFEFGIVQTDEEVEELLKFHAIVHPDDDTEELRRQIDHLPGFSREMNYYIRDLDKDLVRLVLGAYSIKELKQNNIDFIVSSGVRLIAEALFPKRESAIYLYFC